MWLGDLFFGRPEERAYRIDVDDVRDIVAILEHEYPGIQVNVQVVDSSGHGRFVLLDDLEDLSAADLQRLNIDAMVPGWIASDPLNHGSEWQISLRRDAPHFQAPTTLAPNILDEGQTERVVRRIRQTFRDASRPMIRRPVVRWNAVAVLVPLVAMAIAWVWLEVSMALPIAIHVIGWALLVFVAMMTHQRYKFELARLPIPREPKNGHLVLGQTRRQTKADRAGSRRDLKVAALSVLGTVIATVILYVSLGIGRG